MFAGILRDEASPGDVIGRTDLTEFAMILPETSREEAQAMGERIRRKAEWTFGVSSSVTAFPSESSDAKGLIDVARSSVQAARAGV